MILEWSKNMLERWNAVPLYAIARQKSIVHCIDRELLSVYLGVGVVPFSSKAEKRTNVTSADLSKYQAVDYGDFVLNNQQAWRGSVGVSKYVGIVSPAYIVLKLDNTLFIDYANYLFQNRSMVDQYVICSKGVGSIQRNLYWVYLKRIVVPVPPRAEQDQIVRYLDWKVSRINKLINAKRRQIELLREQKQTVINATINNTNANSVLCRYLGRFQNGISESGDFFTDGFPFVNYGDVYNNIALPETVNGKAKSNEKQQNTYSVEEGDIFFTRTSETIDEVGLTSVCFKTIKKAVFSGFVIRMRPKKNLLNNTYAKYYFRSQRVRDYFVKEMNLVTRASLGQTLLKNLPVLLPSMEEQWAVGERLDIQCEKIDRLISAIQKQISFFHEYRTRLISDVVTGKVDVRGVVVPEYKTAEGLRLEEKEIMDDNLEVESE